jgi:hypothetical protein
MGNRRKRVPENAKKNIILSKKKLTRLELVIRFTLYLTLVNLEHYLLLLVPIYLIYTGRFVVFPLSFSYAVFSYALFCLFHSFVLSGLGLLTGHNLNYMLVPPNCKLFHLCPLFSYHSSTTRISSNTFLSDLSTFSPLNAYVGQILQIGHLLWHLCVVPGVEIHLGRGLFGRLEDQGVEEAQWTHACPGYSWNPKGRQAGVTGCLLVLGVRTVLSINIYPTITYYLPTPLIHSILHTKKSTKISICMYLSANRRLSQYIQVVAPAEEKTPKASHRLFLVLCGRFHALFTSFPPLFGRGDVQSTSYLPYVHCKCTQPFFSSTVFVYFFLFFKEFYCVVVVRAANSYSFSPGSPRRSKRYKDHI